MSQCYSQLTLSDRRRLHQLMERKVPVGEIARQLGRHRSTIYRELKRNTFHDADFPEYSGYYGGIANDISKERRRRLRKLSRHPQLHGSLEMRHMSQLEMRQSSPLGMLVKRQRLEGRLAT